MCSIKTNESDSGRCIVGLPEAMSFKHKRGFALNIQPGTIVQLPDASFAEVSSISGEFCSLGVDPREVPLSSLTPTEVQVGSVTRRDQEKYHQLDRIKKIVIPRGRGQLNLLMESGIEWIHCCNPRYDELEVASPDEAFYYGMLHDFEAEEAAMNEFLAAAG